MVRRRRPVERVLRPDKHRVGELEDVRIVSRHELPALAQAVVHTYLPARPGAELDVGGE